MSSKTASASTQLGKVAERRKSFLAGFEEFVAAFRSVLKGIDAEAQEPAETPAPEPEITVEDVLAQLGENALVLHDVGCQFGKLDHIVFSRDHGLFILEVKPHAGHIAIVDTRLRINGTLPEEDFVSQALHIGYWLVEELRTLTGADVPVSSLLVFPHASLDTALELKEVVITNPKHLLAVIEQTATPLPSTIWESREKLAELFANTAPR